MKYTYEINQDLNVVKRTDETGEIDSVPMSLDNSDYQAYLAQQAATQTTFN